MTRKLHRITGGVIALFLFTHLAVHLFALAGPDAHNAALKSVQWIYRHPLVEPLLIAALLFQISLGIRLALRRWREPGKSGWAKLQLASGFYLAYFIIVHSGAALFTPISARASPAAATTLRITWSSIAPMQPMRKLSTTVSLPG